jgi:cob(I)alamin adenosyltransferase
MKVYTKTGDDGTTGLLGGQRVPKSDPRIECNGVIDELNASIGLASAAAGSELQTFLREIQSDLFAIGAHLTLPDESDKPNNLNIPKLEDQLVRRLEAEIDLAETKLELLKNFILPGGSEVAARLHLSRTICRRAERLLVAFAAQHPLSSIILMYLNRLSDWLFVHARLANHLAGVADVPWKPPK